MKKLSSVDVLAVDLDGTLIRSDTTHELLILCLRWQPIIFPYALLLLFRSRSEGKRWLVQRFGHHIDVEHLPYEKAVLDLIDRYRSENKEVWLVSGADDKIVQSISSHLGLFSNARGSSPGENLTSNTKAAYLTRNIPTGFAYAGNSSQDLKVWDAAEKGYAFNAPSSAFALKSDNGGAPKVEIVLSSNAPLRALRKAMRLHQWMKNILIFLVPGLMLSQLSLIHYFELFGAFACFGLMAGGTYILNDLFDIPDDRKHPTKKLRQIAAGHLSIPYSIIGLCILLGVSIIGAFSLDRMFGWVLLGYGLITVSYSFRLKRLPILDVFVLSGLFSLRVWGGAFIVDAPPSAWLTMFVGLVFLSLALAKRFVEVSKLTERNAVAGRGYVKSDEPMLLAFGAAAANAAVLSLVIYGLLAPSRLIDNPLIMTILAAIIAGWFMRIWMIAVRGELNDDPVLFAVKDKVSLLCLFASALLIASESLRPVWIEWF